MVKAHEKDAVRSKVKPKNAQSLRRSITELAAQENAKVPVERRVTQRDIEVVAARSLGSTAGLERPSRFFAAYREVASFIALATTGKSKVGITQNRDLLAVGHPLSTRKHAMTASAYSEAVARWIAADPRIADEVRPLVAAVYMTNIGSVDYEHAVARLTALPSGLVPQEFIIDSQLEPITASFRSWLGRIFGGGNSSIARSLRARKQLRGRDGQFAEQGGGLQFYARTANGSIKSKVGNHAGNSENGTNFLVEISGDPDIPDGIYSVPASITKAVKAIIPGDDAGTVALPEGVEAVNVSDLQRKDIPDGWKLIKEKGEGESGPDKVYATEDGYEVEVYEGGNYSKDEMQKAYRFNTGIPNIPGEVIGNFTERIDFAGRPNMSGKFDPSKPFYTLYRVETPETKRQAVIMAQRWSDVQQKAELDQDNFEKFYDKSEKYNAEVKAKQEKSAAESKASQEAFEKKAAEVAKQNEQTRAEIDANLAKGLDPFGNTIPDGWSATKDDSALNPPISMKSGDKEFVTTLIKKEDTVFYERTEQGYKGQLTHTEDGGLRGLYQNQEFKDWNEAEQGFAETVEADVNARREAALDAVEGYDEDGELRSMIENGASPDEVLEKLRENKNWNYNEDDYNTRGFVDLPQAVQKAKWKKFEDGLNAIKNMPPEFTPFGEEKTDEVKAQLPETTTKKITELKPGDIFIIDKGKNKGKQQKIEKISSVDSGLMVSFRDADTKKMMNIIFEDPTNETVSVVPSAEPEQDGDGGTPTPTTPAPEPTPPAATKPADDIQWILPEGAYSLWNAGDYEPEGRIDEESPDFTDDPKVLANKFSAEQLKDALAQAIIGVKDFATEFLDELKDLDDEDEEEGAKKKTGPKKKKPKSKNATGFGQLDFSFGDENVPAEAIYSALKEQGEDVDLIAAELYDLSLGESKNVDMLEGLRSPEEVKAQEPSVLLDDFDKDAMDIVELNEEITKQDPAAAAVAQINEAQAGGEDNVFIRDVAVDINSLKSPTDLSSFLGKYIGWAISGSGDEKQAFRALWGVLLSTDGGYTKQGIDDSMLFNGVSNAMQSYNGTEPSIEEVEVIFNEFGYYEGLVKSKARVANGEETLDMQDSPAGAMYRLLAAMAGPNTTSLYRGIQISLDPDNLSMYDEGQILSLDPRSFSDDKALAGKFAGAFGGNEDKAAVIFTIPAGKGNVAKVDNISMFEDEREQLAWGNYRVKSVSTKVNPAGKTLVNVELEALDKRGEALEGFTDDYESLLIENNEVTLPQAYYTPEVEPYENPEVDEAADEAEVAAIEASNPLYIARAYEMEDLIEAFRGSIEDGTGKIQLLDEDEEYTVDVEAVRDALQIQGINTNAVLEDIANTEPDVEAEDADIEPLEPVIDSPLSQIIEEFGTEYDLEGFEQTGPQQGSNQGGTFKDAEGNEFYVKSPKSDQHRRNELLASAFYKLAGVDAAEMRFGSADDGNEKIFSAIIPGNTLGDTDLTPETKKQIQEGFAIDAWLANWDVAGLVNDNIIIDEDGNAFRIDTGGALLFRAMGLPKGTAFGNDVTELDTLRNSSMNPTSAALFGDMTDEDLKASASKLLDISHTDIDNLVDATFDEDVAEELKDKLKARRQFILEKYNLLGDDTSLIAETTKVEEPEAPEADAEEPEQPTPPTPEVPSEAPGNPYVTSDGVPIEIGMQVRHKKTGEVGTVIKYDKGNASYVFVQGEDSSIKNKSTKQLESVSGGGGGGQEVTPEPEPTPEPEAPAPESPETPEEPTTPEPEVAPEPEQTPDSEIDLANYSKMDIRVDKLGAGDLLPQYFPVKNAEENLLKKRAEDPNFELPPTDEIIGAYKAVMPNKRGLKVRNIKTGKERFFEVNKNAMIYDVRRAKAEKPTPEPEAPEPATPEAAQAPTEPKVIDTTASVETAVKDIQSAIDNNQLISFYYNGKIRTMKPMSIWENQKNGKINVYGEDLGDDSKKKNFTVQQMQALPDSNPTKPEIVKAEEPTAESTDVDYGPFYDPVRAGWIKELMAKEGVNISDKKAAEILNTIETKGLIQKWSEAEDGDVINAIGEAISALPADWNKAVGNADLEVSKPTPEPTKLQLHAQWIKDIMAQKGVSISDEKAVEIRDTIESNGLIEKWSSAVDSEIIEAIDEALGPDWNEAVGNTDWEKDEVEDPIISGEQRQVIIDMITKLAGIQGFPTENYVNKVGDPNLTESEGSQLLEELEEYDSSLGGDAKVQAPGPNNEGINEGDEPEPDEAEPTAPALEPGAEVTDKKGNKGTVLKGPNKDNYVFVQFEDGKTGWRSAGSVSTTGEFNKSIKKAAPKATAGKMTPAGTKAVFVESPAGWDTSEFENVPALSDAIALVQNPDDKFAAMRGASTAIDADSIEDLDVRIMRVRDIEGNDGLRLKFKLTSWAGNARTKALMEMTPEQREAEGVTKGQMVVDRIDVGPDGVGQISKDKNSYQGDGVTWTITTPEGIVIKLYRGNYDATSKLSSSKYGQPRAFHNMVQIQAPADVTNEQIADALSKAGVSDVRPATPADSRILVENRLMSVFDGKVDATKNPKGAEREASLQKIKDKYGITPDDVVVSTGASGRIETRLSPEGAQKIVTATGTPIAIQHNISIPGFYGISGDAQAQFEARTDWLAKLIGTPQGGLLSTTTRWTEGVGASGMSSAADIGTGGADYVFTKPVKVADAKTYGTSGMLMYFDPVKVYQRLDFYANSGDNFGKRQVNQDVINAAKVGAYELMFKHRLSFDDLDSIVISTQAQRTAVIQKLRQMGIDQIGGRPLEAVIVIGSNVNPNS